MEKYSTGFVDAINTVDCVKNFMANGVMGIFGGASQPANADAAETGTLLALVTLNGGEFTAGVATNGINMDSSSDGELSNDKSETWSGDGLAAAGTGVNATWFRWYSNDYVTGASTTAIRADGDIGTTFGDLQVSGLSVVEGVPFQIDSFTYIQNRG